MAKHALKILPCPHLKIFKVYLAIFLYYAGSFNYDDF